MEDGLLEKAAQALGPAELRERGGEGRKVEGSRGKGLSMKQT